MLRHRQEDSGSGETRAARPWSWLRGRKSEAMAAAHIEAEAEKRDEVAARLAAMQRAIARRRESLRMVRVGVWTVMFGLAVTIGDLLTRGEPRLGTPMFWLPCSLIIGGGAMVIAIVLRGEIGLRAAVAAAASTDDMRAVGPLAEALALGEPSYSLAVSALSRLLPGLLPSDAHLLTEAQRTSLLIALRHSSSRVRFWRHDPRFAEILRRALTTLDVLPSDERTTTVPPSKQAVTDVEALLDLFRYAVRQHRNNQRAAGGGAVTAALLALANWIVPALTHLPPSPALLAAAVGAIVLTLALSASGTAALKAMMNRLAGAGDLRVVGPLIEIAAIHDGNANPMAALLLTRLLPRLRASDSALLTDGQHAALVQAFASNSGNADFLVAALRALEQVGDGQALAVVSRLAAGGIRTAEPKRVQAAARECLPYLQARHDQREASATLLRASGASASPPTALLRPASGAAPNAASLLRPNEPSSVGSP